MRIKSRWIFVLLAAALLCILFFRAGVFLSSPGVEPQEADAIVVLGGGSKYRTFRGLELYRKKYAPVVLLAGVQGLGLPAQKRHTSWQAQILIRGGVKKDGIAYDPVSANTWQEAENTLKLAKACGWKKVIVVSDPPHMRRLKWTWGKVFNGSGVDFILVSSALSGWNAERWWADDQSSDYLVSEYVKMVYYFLRY